MQQHGVTLANWCMLVAGVEQWMLLEAVGPCTSGDIKASCNAVIKIITTMMPHGLHLDFQQLVRPVCGAFVLEVVAWSAVRERSLLTPGSHSQSILHSWGMAADIAPLSFELSDC